MNPRCGECASFPRKNVTPAGSKPGRESSSSLPAKKHWIPARAALGRNDDSGDKVGLNLNRFRRRETLSQDESDGTHERGAHVKCGWEDLGVVQEKW